MNETLAERKPAGKILIVEDEALIREMLREILSHAGHEIVCAADGDEGLKLALASDFDLLLCDIHLPGINGLDLLARLKAERPAVSVVILTGHPALDKAIEAMKRGASDFVTKPFGVEQILHVVQKNLKERRLALENQRLLAELNNKAVIDQLNRQLHSKVDQLTRLYTVSESFHSFVDNDSLLQYVVDLASDLLDAQRVSLLTFDRRRKYLVVRASRGISTEVLRRASIKIGEGVAGRVARDYRPIRVSEQESGDRDAASPDRPYLTRSWLSVPLFIGDQLFGVLNLTDKRDRTDFTEEDEYLAMVLAEKAGIKLENNVLYEGIYANLLDTLKALVSTIEAKDAYTRHHSQRVTDVALALARRLGCTEEERESIGFAGILHDIGKIGIRDGVLLKPSRLTREEYEEIKHHPIIGERIVAPLGLIETEKNIIRHHHERPDGLGYPDGLKGDEIPLPTRIVSVADAFDAMTSTRSYRRSLEMPVVMEELRKNSGRQFFPEIVDAMIALIEEGEIAAEDQPVSSALEAAGESA